MPKITLPIPETSASCTRPVVVSIVKDLIDMTGIPKDVNIFYPGDSEKAFQPGSDIATHQTGINTTPFSSRIQIEVDENYEMDRLLSTAVYQTENLFIFRDDRIDTFIKPVYSSADITINFKYRAIDKTSAMRWRDDIRTRVGMMWDMRMHEVSYHYLIPPEFLVILKELHRMRENVYPYGETYDQYFQANITKNATVFTTLAGTHAAWGIAEKQLRIMGYFDFEGVPEQGSKEDDGDTWTISFAYKIKYDKPIECAMFYPLVIHNQLVAQNYRPNPTIDKVDPLFETDYNYSSSAANFSAFDKTLSNLNVLPGLAIPNFDEFIPSSVPLNTFRLFTALVNIDPLTPTFLLSLKDMGNTVIAPAILNFMIGEAPYMTRNGMSIFTLSLYRSIDLLEESKVAIDSNLNIHTTQLLSLRQYYHIRLGLAIDLTQVSSAALDRLRNHGDALVLLLSAIDSTLLSKGKMPKVMVGNYVAKLALQDAIDSMNAVTLSQGNGQKYCFNTVQTLFIQSSLNKG